MCLLLTLRVIIAHVGGIDLKVQLTLETRRWLRDEIDRLTRSKSSSAKLNGSVRLMTVAQRKAYRKRRYRRMKNSKWEKEGLRLCEGEVMLECLVCGRRSHKFNWRRRHFRGCPNSTEGKNDFAG
jgi:hypothetical protein